MNKEQWYKIIKEETKKAGTYRPYFESVIDSFADLLEVRDQVTAEYKASGKGAVIEFTNKAGATNLVKNPAAVLVEEYNKLALAYWRELGLTPTGLKRIDTGAMNSKKNKSSFSDVLKDLGI